MSTKLAVTPEKIMQLGLGFWSSKTFLSAVELGLFTELATGPLSGDQLTERLQLHPRAARDFFDALVSLGMLEREGGLYRNTPDTDLFLDRNKLSYIGGMLEMANERLYGFWGTLTEGLRTGLPQNEIKSGMNGLFEGLYSDPHRLRLFLAGMTGLSMGASRGIAEKFPWDNYKTVVDVGGAQGGLLVQVCLAHSHITGANFDLAPVQPIFDDYVAAHGLSTRLKFVEGNFFEEKIPTADVITMATSCTIGTLTKSGCCYRKHMTHCRTGAR